MLNFWHGPCRPNFDLSVLFGKGYFSLACNDHYSVVMVTNGTLVQFSDSTTDKQLCQSFCNLQILYGFLPEQLCQKQVECFLCNTPIRASVYKAKEHCGRYLHFFSHTVNLVERLKNKLIDKLFLGTHSAGLNSSLK